MGLDIAEGHVGWRMFAMFADIEPGDNGPFSFKKQLSYHCLGSGAIPARPGRYLLRMSLFAGSGEHPLCEVPFAYGIGHWRWIPPTGDWDDLDDQDDDGDGDGRMSRHLHLIADSAELARLAERAAAPASSAAEPHRPLPGYHGMHLAGGWCQCRCDDCYSRLLGACLCLDCCCDDVGQTEAPEHNVLAWALDLPYGDPGAFQPYSAAGALDCWNVSMVERIDGQSQM